MKIIGISGQPGAGKTTVSNLLLKEENTKVIHLDHIYDHIKRKIPGDLITHNLRDDGVETMCISHNSLYKFIKNNPILNDVYFRLRNIIGRRITLNLISKAIEAGYDYLILEGASLYYFLGRDELDNNILITSDNDTRRKRIEKRNTPLEQILNAELADITYPEIEPDYIIYNVGTYEELEDLVRLAEEYIIDARDYSSYY